MNCMKCGREVEEGQVFCALCLSDMAKYPVKPGIAIQLPTRKETNLPKKNPPKRRQPPKPEEQLRLVRQWLKHILILWLITLLLLAAAIYPTVQYFLEKTPYRPGQNYNTFTSSMTEPK